MVDITNDELNIFLASLSKLFWMTEGAFFKAKLEFANVFYKRSFRPTLHPFWSTKSYFKCKINVTTFFPAVL